MASPRSLDEPSVYASLDPSGMSRRLLNLAAQSRLGWELGSSARLPGSGRPTHVVVAGMGGSAIGGVLIRGLADRSTGALPVTVWRDYGMPAWVGPGTLVAAVSVSGDTVETRSALRSAVRQGARCLAISGPGRLSQEARDAGGVVLQIKHEGEPRSALGFTFVALYRALQVIGAMPDSSAGFEASLTALEQYASTLATNSPVDVNPAKQIALWLEGRLPVIYGPRHLSGVANRWKTQFNENADCWAINDDIPEANHNSVQGYRLPAVVLQAASMLILDSAALSDEIRVRLQLTAELMREEGVTHRLIDTGGSSLQDDILRGCLLGDMTSYYLAILLGRDPSSTATLTRLKDRTHSMPAGQA